MTMTISGRTAMRTPPPAAAAAVGGRIIIVVAAALAHFAAGLTSGEDPPIRSAGAAAAAAAASAAAAPRFESFPASSSSSNSNLHANEAGAGPPGLLTLPIRTIGPIDDDDSHPSVTDDTYHRRRALYEDDADAFTRDTVPTDGSFSHLSTHMGWGTHFVDVFVGDPLQEQTLALSMTSLVTAFPCKGCKNCGQAGRHHEFFDQFASNPQTFHYLPCDECTSQAKCVPSYDVCGMDETYVDESSRWTAVEATDVAYVGGEPRGMYPAGTNFGTVYGFPLTFGCQTSLDGYYATNVADGIISMAPQSTSFVNQMYDAGKLRKRFFALCFDPVLTRVGDGRRSAGAVTLGGYETDYHLTPLVYAKSTKPGRSYSVHIKRMYVRAGGGQSARRAYDGQETVPIRYNYDLVNSGGRGVILDSGAPYTNLCQCLEEPFRTAWRAVTGSDYTNGRLSLTKADILRLPTILFQISAYDEDLDVDPAKVTGLVGDLDPTSPRDVLVAMPASHYMEYNPTTGHYRSRLFFGNQNGSVLGANFMQGHDITFDLEEHKMGFAEVLRCEKSIDDTSEDGGGDDGGAGHDDSEDGGGGGDGDGGVVFEDSVPRTNTVGRVKDLGSYGREDSSSSPDGTCISATCRSFVAVGWALLILVAFLIFVARRQGRQTRGAHFRNMDRAGADEAHGGV